MIRLGRLAGMMVRWAFVLACVIFGCGPALAQAVKAQPEDASKFKIEVLDQSFAELIDPDAQIRVLADGFEWVEGPVWDKAKQTLYFSDVPQNNIFQFEDGRLSEFLARSGYDGPAIKDEPGSNGLVMDAGGHLIVCDHGNRRVYRLGKDGKTKTTIIDKYDGKRFNSPNDLVIKSNGDMFFTDPPYGLTDEANQEQSFCGVYCLKADGSIHLVTQELVRPNGVALSPDEKTLYVAQSHRPKPVYMKYAINADGSFGEGELLYDSSGYASDAAANPGVPDGLVIDVRGNLWATGPGGVLVISPAGKLLGRVYTGKRTANCTFSGDGSALVMTADDQLLVVKTKTRGLGDWGPDNPNNLIPVDVVTEINKAVAEMRGFVERKEFGKLIEAVATPEFVKAQKKSGEFKRTVEGFAKRKAGEFKQMLDEIVFTNAKYSPKDQTITFIREDKNATFEKVAGEWKLRN